MERRSAIDLAQVERRLKKFAKQREETPLPTGLPPIDLLREQVLDLNSQLSSELTNHHQN